MCKIYEQELSLVLFFYPTPFVFFKDISCFRLIKHQYVVNVTEAGIAGVSLVYLLLFNAI